MHFLVHHATGVLMLRADSREEAVAWSCRQLARSDLRFSILEWQDLADEHEAVEKSGTGIREIQCTQSQVNLVPDAVQQLVVQGGLQTIDDVFCKSRMETAPAAVH